MLRSSYVLLLRWKWGRKKRQRKRKTESRKQIYFKKNHRLVNHITPHTLSFRLFQYFFFLFSLSLTILNAHGNSKLVVSFFVTLKFENKQTTYRVWDIFTHLLIHSSTTTTIDTLYRCFYWCCCCFFLVHIENMTTENSFADWAINSVEIRKTIIKNDDDYVNTHH